MNLISVLIEGMGSRVSGDTAAENETIFDSLATREWNRIPGLSFQTAGSKA